MNACFPALGSCGEPKCDCDHDRLAQRVAKLEEQLFAPTERIGTLEADNARLREENRQLREENARLRAEVERLAKENTRLEQRLAAARKDSSTSSKPPSSDIVKSSTARNPSADRRHRVSKPGV